MSGVSAVRIISAVAIGVIGLAAASLLGAASAAALLAFAAGVIAAALMLAFARERPTAVETAGDDERGPEVALAELLDAIDEPMLAVRERRVVAANPAARMLLGEHIAGTDVRLALRHPAAAELLTGPPEGAGKTSRIELVGIGGPDRQWSMSVTGLTDGSHLVYLVDQSKVRAAEQMRADFVANASHELRTPLATLLGFLETLQDEETASDTKTRARFLGIMFDEATRMRALVDDLMSLSRIEADRFAAPADPVDLLAVVDGVRESVGVLSAARDSPLVLQKEAGATIVPGDRAQLAQLLRNLVINALNYGRPGTPVRIRLEEAGVGMLRIAVIDQGEGIAPEHIPRLTERFYRVDPGRSRSVGGTGLGLAIAKHIALRHRGRLEIVSRQGEGTAVHVYLPHALGGGA